ncbi:MAG TPA: PDC sensor domain-containing protein [Methanolinea sp.]|nr:PDC sensor domain-containing protein [Methanolinea sp.]
MTRFPYLILLAIALSLVLSAGCLQEQQASGGVHDRTTIRHAIMQKLLHEMTGTIQTELSMFNTTLDEAASMLGTTGLSGPKADSLLADLASSHPAVLSAITVDANGTVLSAAPGNARILIGQNIVDQEAISKVLATRQPTMGNYFTLRQGGEGVAIVYPVFSPGGQFLGALSMAFSPSILVTRHTKEVERWAPFTYAVAQPDGVLLSHTYSALAGKQALDEPIFAQFPELLDFVRRSDTERTGYATFSFFKEGSTEIVPKETFWDTVYLYDSEWRVFVNADRE